MNFKSSDEEVGGEMDALQLESGETAEDVEEDGMVAIAVTIDEELLRRIETSVHPLGRGGHQQCWGAEGGTPKKIGWVSFQQIFLGKAWQYIFQLMWRDVYLFVK